MDGRSFVKCLKDAGLLDERLKTVQADLIFARHKPKGSRRISYDLFIQALTEVAMKRDLLPEEAVDRVCLAHGPDYESATTAFEDAAGPERFFYDKTTYTGMHKCSSASQQLVMRPSRSRDLPESWASPEDYDLPKSGPERFYYDRSTYTGTHKNNGPSAAGSGVGKEGYSDLSVLVRRDVVQDDVLQRRRRSKTSNSPNGSGSLPVLLGGHQTFKPKETKAEPQPQPNASPEPLKAATQPAAPLAQAQASPSPMMGARYIHDIPTFNATSASLGALGAWPGLGPPAYVPPVMQAPQAPQMAPMAPAPGSPQMASPQRAPMSAVPQTVPQMQVVGAHSPPPASWSPMGNQGYPTMVQRWPAPAYKAF